MVLDGTDLSTEEMQQFTRWTNLSEATFVLPPTPEGAPLAPTTACASSTPLANCFAGHPRWAPAAWLEAGGQPQVAGRIVQECGVGLVTIRQQAICWHLPRHRCRSGPLDEADVALIARGLGVAREDIVQHAWCDNGPGWRAVLLASSAQVLALKARRCHPRWAGRGRGGACSRKQEPPHRVARWAWWAAAMRTASRLKCAPSSLATTVWPEDPVTGSLNAALAQWLMARAWPLRSTWPARAPAWSRAGRVHVQQEGDTIWWAATA